MSHQKRIFEIVYKKRGNSLERAVEHAEADTLAAARALAELNLRGQCVEPRCPKSEGWTVQSVLLSNRKARDDHARAIRKAAREEAKESAREEAKESASSARARAAMKGTE